MSFHDDELRWPDIEAMLISYLSQRLRVDWVSTDVPGALEGTTGVRVKVATGNDDGRVNDYTQLDVEAFAPSRADAVDLASDVRAQLHRLGGRHAGGKLVDSVSTVLRPVRVSYQNLAVERVIAVYRVTTRPQT